MFDSVVEFAPFRPAIAEIKRKDTGGTVTTRINCSKFPSCIDDNCVKPKTTEPNISLTVLSTTCV